MDQMVKKEIAAVCGSEFWNGKRVFITGHTGFKGAWLSYLLLHLGAELKGYALEPERVGLFNILSLDRYMESKISDIRNFEQLSSDLESHKSDIVIHMAAQPLVRDSYRMPRYTYDVNFMGTLNLLEAVRNVDSVQSFVNVTTDKVYENKEWMWGYREDELLGGFDPYSNSKACSEMVTKCYMNSFFQNKEATAISTARAGNVIGGGDFAKERIIPDCYRAAETKDNIIIRNPESIRPYQHVLDSLNGYLVLAEKQYSDKERIQGSYNFGPKEEDCIDTLSLVKYFCDFWGDSLNWEVAEKTEGFHEAGYLKLDCSKAKESLNWRPRWGIQDAVEKTVEWFKVYQGNGNISSTMDKQINEFISGE